MIFDNTCSSTEKCHCSLAFIKALNLKQTSAKPILVGAIPLFLWIFKKLNKKLMLQNICEKTCCSLFYKLNLKVIKNQEQHYYDCLALTKGAILSIW